MDSADIDLTAHVGAAARQIRLNDWLTPAGADEADRAANRWIKQLRRARIDGVPFRDRFQLRGDSLWWFAELYLHKRRIITRAFRALASLDAVLAQHAPTTLVLHTSDPVVLLVARMVGTARTIAVTARDRRTFGGTRVRSVLKATFHTTAAFLDRARPGAPPPRGRGGVVSFVHSAFWRRDRDEESYIGPILSELEHQRPGVARLVGVGPRTNFRIRRWSDRVAEFGDPAARGLPFTPVEAFAGWSSLAPSRAVWAERRATRDALQASTDIRSHAIVNGIDLWPLVATELGGIADLQFPWSARAMDEAGAALDHLKPSAVITYAEAGGWGRAIMLEARRRGITTIGVQHGFIYRHWLNYLHEPDEMTASEGNQNDTGFPRPTSTLLFDGFAEEHLRRNGHFPEGSTLVTGSPRLEQFVKTAAALSPGDREAIRREAGGVATGRIVLVAAKHDQLGPWFRALVDAVAATPAVRIVVKPHPAEGSEPYIRDAAHTQAVFIAPPQADLARLTAVADVLVTANSTAAIEAMAIGVPALVVGLPTNLSPFVDAGAMAGVSRVEDLPGALSRVIGDDRARRDLLAAAAAFCDRYAIVQPPGAAQRAAAAILMVAGGPAGTESSSR